MVNESERPFKEVSVIATYEQAGSELLLSEDSDDPDDADSPIKTWRCNLTALSHEYNLYFVARTDTVHVYQPDFPTQKLPPRPAIVLSLPASQPDRRGEIDPFDPHSVNHLIVDFFGNREILLVSCDDGDVIAYNVWAIQAAIDRNQNPDPSQLICEEDVRPFFTENVGRSAWGLSIHREARMIAVSANSHEITVFAFALTNTSALPSLSVLSKRNSDGNAEEDASDKLPDFPYVRAKDHRIILRCPSSNLPNVAFCNNGDDPAGRWLLATNVAGQLLIWDLHKTSLVRTIRLGYRTRHPLNDRETPSYSPKYSGWGVIWLDRRAFRKESTRAAALGGTDSLPEKALPSGRWWDISSTRNDVQNASVWYGGKEEWFRRFAERDVALSLQSNFAYAISIGRRSAAEFGEPLPYEAPFFEESASSDNSSEETTKDLSSLPLSPILHCSVRNIALLQRMKGGNTGVSFGPIIGFHHPLYQALLPDANGSVVSLERGDRLSLYRQIPDLGVVVVGSPVGRVAVLSLTQINAGSKDVATTEKIYAFRLDHILPFHDQELRDLRPLEMLIGVAVGPVQGTRGTDGRARRWRLLLTYADHTTLSYELGKYNHGAEGVEVLVI